MGNLLKRIDCHNAKWNIVYDIYEEENDGNPFIAYYIIEKSLGDNVFDVYMLPIEHKEKLLAYKDGSMFHRGNFVREFGKLVIRGGKKVL